MTRRGRRARFARATRPTIIRAPAGVVGSREGVITSAGDSLQIRLFGRGAHGSMPQARIDPVVMAASTVLRLQTIVSREVAATDAVVLTAIERIVKAGAEASGSPKPPEITPLDRYDMVQNDPEAIRHVGHAFRGRLGDLPTNHNARFAPVLRPKLETGVETLVVAALAWLAA